MTSIDPPFSAENSGEASIGLSFPPFHERAQSMTSRDLRRVELTDAIRELIHDSFITLVEEDDLESATRLVRDALAHVSKKTHRFSDGPMGMSFLDRSPFMGAMNPMSMPLSMSIVSDENVKAVESRVVFTMPYEGPPGHVHGGFIAAAFDEVLGMTQSLSGRPGMTGNLSIDYRKPTPLYEELLFRGELLSVDGRRIYTRATLHCGETLCAEATGLFLSMKKEVLDRFLASQRAGESAVD